jgi:hypothetical protein
MSYKSTAFQVLYYIETPIKIMSKSLSQDCKDYLGRYPGQETMLEHRVLKIGTARGRNDSI